MSTPLKRREERLPVNPLADQAAGGADDEAGAPGSKPGDAHGSASEPVAAGVAPAYIEAYAQPANGAAADLPHDGGADGDLADDHASDLDETIDHVRSVLDSRVLSAAVLAGLLFAIIGFDNLVLLAIFFFGGYLLIDRFINVRRGVTLGGFAWLVVLLLGNLLTMHMPPLLVNINLFFMLFGLLLALATCGVFFAARAMYYYGYERGQEEADRVIARHMVDRLIEHPDDWSHVDGTYVEVEGALNQVRDRQRAGEQALRDESRRKDDLVTYLAHDLKTPLASVVGYLSLLEEADDLPAKQRKHFTGIALDKAHRLDALIEEFFDITRFDFHDIVLTRGYVSLDLMLAQVADEFYPILASQGKKAEVACEPGLTVLIDGDKMARVFNNVMKNAVAYSYEGSTIRVRAERDGDSVRIRFENQGDPIPEPKLKLIFQKFYRLDAARATNHGGAGLGLAIAKEIVTAHGGQISCESNPEHTVFTIVLPMK